MFAKYLHHFLGAETDYPTEISSWTDLHRWMDRQHFPAMKPPLKRVPIAPKNLDRSWKRILRDFFSDHKTSRRQRDRASGWQSVVAYRQRITLALTLASTVAILYLSYLALRAQQMPEIALELYLAIYGIMVFFMASSFYKMMLGTWHALRGPAGNPWHPSHSARDPRPGVRVAILFPIYHEEVARVAAGVAATWRSIVMKHPSLATCFDVFLLSDSRKLEYWIAEEAAVHRLREAMPEGRFFYRRRLVNQNAKLGNITDFCRRWGRSYEYMLIMDADSVMDGDAIATLLRMMEGNRRIGILQTNPTPILRESLFGRMQQFASRLYGSVFSYSLQAMYMGHACYIGHNAIVRLKPFIRHCILPELSGAAPWGGKPLSHDIVESAMMARAGYEVWFLPEIEGSYEEVPANLSDFLIRERRWMQGNIQHMRFLFLSGLRSVYRETFVTGSMGYAAAPLWAVFLLISAYGIFHFMDSGIMALTGIRSLEMPMLMLFASSLVLLFMPRILTFAIHIESGKARGFGGKDKLAWSLLLETLFSIFFSPIMMICISHFIWQWLKGRAIRWDAQKRADYPLGWNVCLQRFGWISLIGLAGLVAMVYKLYQVPQTTSAILGAFTGGRLLPSDLVIWLLPILVGFTASPWVARVTSFPFPGLQTRKLFAIPEEVCTPAVVKAVIRWKTYFEGKLPSIDEPDRAIDYALRDPQFYVWHRPETRTRPRIARPLMSKIQGGEPLAGKELLSALTERKCFDALHIANAKPQAEPASDAANENTKMRMRG